MGDGNVDTAKGRIKKAAGDLTDDDDLRREGKVGGVLDTVTAQAIGDYGVGVSVDLRASRRATGRAERARTAARTGAWFAWARLVTAWSGTRRHASASSAAERIAAQPHPAG